MAVLGGDHPRDVIEWLGEDVGGHEVGHFPRALPPGLLIHPVLLLGALNHAPASEVDLFLFFVPPTSSAQRFCSNDLFYVSKNKVK